VASPELRVSSGGKSSFHGLIAWLSVCLLATAWGPRLDASLRERSAEMGAFGLAAALGLEATGRTRKHMKNRSQQKAASRRLARNLGNAVAHKSQPNG
jgi:hypothetical protein